MGVEIERKFLVVGDAWRGLAPGISCRQGYLSVEPDRTVRVRTIGERGLLTVKGRTSGAVRPEFEYEIPFRDAVAMLDRLCLRPLVEKNRHFVVHEGFRWEVDEFLAENAGLVVAEIELSGETQGFPRPPWLGAEVTGDARYFNASLVGRPFSSWPAV